MVCLTSKSAKCLVHCKQKVQKSVAVAVHVCLDWVQRKLKDEGGFLFHPSDKVHYFGVVVCGTCAHVINI